MKHICSFDNQGDLVRSDVHAFLKEGVIRYRVTMTDTGVDEVLPWAKIFLNAGDAAAYARRVAFGQPEPGDSGRVSLPVWANG